METKRSAPEKRINTNHTTTLMKINRYIDHTLLSPTATPDDIVKLCEEAIEHDFYAVCVNGCYVDLAKRVLRESNVKIASVVGFPLGASSVEAKIKEAIIATEMGADEIDMVLNVGYLKGEWNWEAESEIKFLKKEIGKTTLKVILETCYLTDDEIIRAIEICKKAKADFIKTSTGFGSGGADERVVELMLKHAGKMKVKASGGIRDAETAKKYIEMGVKRLGTSSGVAIVTSKTSINKDEHTY